MKTLEVFSISVFGMLHEYRNVYSPYIFLFTFAPKVSIQYSYLGFCESSFFRVLTDQTVTCTI